ncbi:MAG: hypothetical protein ACOYOJ_09500 [Alsobacter sp.]
MRRAHITAHRVIWIGLAMLLPLILVAGFAQRAWTLPDRPSVRLGPGASP